MSWVKLPEPSAPKGAKSIGDYFLRESDSKLGAEPMKSAREEHPENKQLCGVARVHSFPFKLTKPAAVLIKGKKRRGRVAKGSAIAPLQHPIWPYIRLKLSFQNGATAILMSSNGIITVGDVFGAIGVIGRVVNTSATGIATAFRIRRVTVFSGTNDAGAFENVGIQWYSSNTDHEPDMRYSAPMPTTSALIQHVTSVPPKNSTCGFWHKNTTDPAQTVFALAINNAYSVVELDLDFCLSTAIVPMATFTLATVAIGTFYRLALNRVNGSSTLVPVDFTTTT